MVDGTGTTTYSYHPTTATPQLGAGQLKDVDGPLASDVIAYTYDELGRVTNRTINGSANSVTWAFDALGRVTSEVNLLGTFSYTYAGTSPRLATVTYPNSQTSTYSYLGASNDHRLQTIHHKYPNGSTLSKFDYTYDAAGNILTWRQQADTTAVLWEYGYDTADQLVTAVKKSTDPTPQILQRFAYTYDPAGNRTAEQIDDAVTTSTYNNMNQLVSQAPGGLLRFEGTLNEPATVTIGGKPATVTGDNRFMGHTAVGTGTSQIEIRAIDPNGNIRTNTYEVSQSGTAKTFTFDANGNMTGDGTRMLEWDARNQLIVVSAGTDESLFSYDGLRRRVQAKEYADAVLQTETRRLWCGPLACESRASDGISVQAREFGHGAQAGGSAQYGVFDHLGSTESVLSATGMVLARYTFSPWGAVSLTGGSDQPVGRYAGHDVTASTSRISAMYRSYDPQLGRWLNEDPAGFVDGPNKYAYVHNNPIRFVDELGLYAGECTASCIERIDGIGLPWQQRLSRLFPNVWSRHTACRIRISQTRRSSVW